MYYIYGSVHAIPTYRVYRIYDYRLYDYRLYDKFFVKLIQMSRALGKINANQKSSKLFLF